MLKALTSDLLKYSADVSVRLKSVMEQSQEVETCSTAQLDKVMNAMHCTDLTEDGQLEVEYFFRILQA